MIDDPIVEEVRKHREAHAARYNYDLAAIFAALLEREKSSTRPVVNRPPRRLPGKPRTETLPMSAPRIIEKTPFDTTQLGALYAEFVEEDRAMAEDGIAEYSAGLIAEDVQ